MAKTKIIHKLMYRLARNEKLTINTELANNFNINTRTLNRYLDEIANDYKDIIVVEKEKSLAHSRKPSVYSAIDPKKDLVNTLNFFFEKRTDLGWVLQLLHERDPILSNDGAYQEEINKLISRDSDTYVFKSTPFEILNSTSQKIFTKLKTAIKYSEYKTIVYDYDGEENLEDVKCLKLVFTQNNWYLAIEEKTELFRLLRISFIQELNVSKKGNYQKGRMQLKYEKHYEKIQNAMTLYGEANQIATCKASARIAKYFKKDMKPFLNSQKYLKTCDDGSIDFELSYTQAIEILPFIKQWLPDIKILKPQSLADELKQDILQASQDYIS